jgi:hypothetical protein
MAVPISFVSKVYLLCVLFTWIRGTLPRLCANQPMQFAWEILIPATLGNILLTGLISLAVSGLGLSNLALLIVTGAINWLLLIGFIRLEGRATVATTRRAQAPALRAQRRAAAAAQLPERAGVASSSQKESRERYLAEFQACPSTDHICFSAVTILWPELCNRRPLVVAAMSLSQAEDHAISGSATCDCLRSGMVSNTNYDLSTQSRGT